MEFTESLAGNCSPRGESRRRTQAREVTSPHSFWTGLEVAAFWFQESSLGSNEDSDVGTTCF